MTPSGKFSRLTLQSNSPDGRCIACDSCSVHAAQLKQSL